MAGSAPNPGGNFESFTPPPVGDGAKGPSHAFTEVLNTPPTTVSDQASIRTAGLNMMENNILPQVDAPSDTVQQPVLVADARGSDIQLAQNTRRGGTDRGMEPQALTPAQANDVKNDFLEGTGLNQQDVNRMLNSTDGMTLKQAGPPTIYEDKAKGVIRIEKDGTVALQVNGGELLVVKSPNGTTQWVHRENGVARTLTEPRGGTPTLKEQTYTQRGTGRRTAMS